MFIAIDSQLDSSKASYGKVDAMPPPVVDTIATSFLYGRKQDKGTHDGKKTSTPKFSRGDGFDGPAPKSTHKPVYTVKPAVMNSGDGFAQSTPRPRNSSRQFAQTPRFGAARSEVPSLRTTQPESPAGSSLVHALRPHVRSTEEVEEPPSQETNDEDDEMLEVQPEQVLPTTEGVEYDRAWTQDLPHSPKRRKVDNMAMAFETTLGSPARHAMFKHPTTPASALRSGPQQFTRASSVASSAADEGSSIRRPAFLRSSVAPSEQSEPLPNAFSPHRRGEKFVPGGMAATLQQWVVETGQAAAHSRRGQGYLNGETYLHRVRVETRSGRSPMLVQGRLQDDVQVWLMLVSDAKRRSSCDVSPGSIVGVRAPCWEVDVEGRNWIVGIDWKVVT